MKDTGRPKAIPDSHTKEIQRRLNRGEQQKMIATCYGCSPRTVSRFVQRHQLRRDNTHLNGTRDNLRMLRAYSQRYAKRHFRILRDQRFLEADYEELLSRFNALILDVLRMFVPDLLRDKQSKPASLRTYFFTACENAAQDYRQELADGLREREFDSEYEVTKKAVPKYSAYCFDCKTSWKWGDNPKALRRDVCPYCQSSNGKRLKKAGG